MIENRLTFVCSSKHTAKLLGHHRMDLGHYSALLLFEKWKIRRVIDMHIANIFAEAVCFHERWIDEYIWSYIHGLCHDLEDCLHDKEGCALI